MWPTTTFSSKGFVMEFVKFGVNGVCFCQGLCEVLFQKVWGSGVLGGPGCRRVGWQLRAAVERCRAKMQKGFGSAVRGQNAKRRWVRGLGPSCREEPRDSFRSWLQAFPSPRAWLGGGCSGLAGQVSSIPRTLLTAGVSLPPCLSGSRAQRSPWAGSLLPQGEIRSDLLCQMIFYIIMNGIVILPSQWFQFNSQEWSIVIGIV